MLDIFMFIFVHSIVELVSDFHIDVHGMMVPFLVCADVGPRLPPRHWRKVVNSGNHVSTQVLPANV